MIDAHTHLNSDKIFSDRQQHVLDFIAAGGQGLITIGIDQLHNTRNLDICKQRLIHPETSSCSIRCTVGVHPCSVGQPGYDTTQAIDQHIATLREQITTHPEHIVGIGECGIDAHRGDYAALKSLQHYAFRQQCELARETNLPIVIHSRDQRPDTLTILQEFSDLKIYLHCRGYSPDQIQEAADHLPDLRIGFCGNTTYPKAQPLRDSLILAWQLQSQEKCKIVIETDAPYLAPQSRRGKMNVPAYLAESVSAFAEVLGISQDTFLDTTIHNTTDLYML